MPGLNKGTSRAHQVQTFTGSADTGPFFLEAKGWDDFSFSFFSTGTVTGASVTVYGTTDDGTAGTLATWNPQPGYVIPAFVSNNRWFPLIPRASQGEAAGSTSNPVQVFNGTVSIVYDKPLVAVRMVCSAFTGGGTIYADCFATG